VSAEDASRPWWERSAWPRAYTEMVTATMEAGDRATEAWLDAVDDATRQEFLDEEAAVPFDVYGVWMQAARDTFEHATEAVEGEDVPVERFRDTWLTAANRAFKRAMSTSAFADATGRSTDATLAWRQEWDEAMTDALHAAGLPTDDDVREVGERLVEVERRQHGVEERLDDAIAALDDVAATLAEHAARDDAADEEAAGEASDVGGGDEASSGEAGDEAGESDESGATEEG